MSYTSSNHWFGHFNCLNHLYFVHKKKKALLLGLFDFTQSIIELRLEIGKFWKLKGWLRRSLLTDHCNRLLLSHSLILNHCWSCPKKLNPRIGGCLIFRKLDFGEIFHLCCQYLPWLDFSVVEDGAHFWWLVGKKSPLVVKARWPTFARLKGEGWKLLLYLRLSGQQGVLGGQSINWNIWIIESERLAPQEMSSLHEPFSKYLWPGYQNDLVRILGLMITLFHGSQTWFQFD